MDHEGSDQLILEQMHETRTALADKLETLENRVVDTVQSATSAVSDTVENVKEAVQDTVATVTDSVQTTITTVKESFDLRLQVERHPWAIMCGAVAFGYVVERLLAASSGSKPASESAPRGPWPSNGVARQAQETFQAGGGEEKTGGAAGSTSPGGLCSGLAELLGPEIARAKGLLFGALLGSVRDSVLRFAPAAIRDGVADIVDSMTRKLGGEVVPSTGISSTG